MRFLKLLCSIILVCMLIPLSSTFAATTPAKADAKAKANASPERPVQLVLDGKPLDTPVPARIMENYTFVPLRVIADEFNAKITWDNEKKNVIIEEKNNKISLFIGMKKVYINGLETEFEVAPIIDSGTTLVPLRFVAERFGVQFKYDGDTKTVHMESAPPPVIEPGDEVNNGNKPLDPDVNNGNETNNGDKDPVDQEKSSLVTGITLNENGIIIQTDADKPETKMFNLDNPSRLVIDIPNARLDAKLSESAKVGEGNLVSNHPLITQVRYSQYSQSPATVRVTLELKKGANHFIVPQTPQGQIAVEITTYSIPSHKVVVIDGVKKYTVVLDAGHGGTDPGASSILNRAEKDFTLPMIMKVGAILEKQQHLNVLYTRKDDTFVELDDRVAFANNNNAAVFLSIHGNKFDKKTVNGTETYYWREDSIGLANIIHENVLKMSGFADRGVRKNNFRVITKTTMPAVLLEAGYLSNLNNEALMYNEAFQNNLAESIAESIIEFTGIKEGIK